MSPVVTRPQALPTSITRPEELVEYLAWYLDRGKHTFSEPIAYIAKYDEDLIPKYPALHIQAASFDKTLHSTSTFLVAMRAAIHVLHANMMENRQTRNYQDLLLATSVADYIESSMTLANPDNPEGVVIQGWIESEIPGILPPRVTKGDAIVSTRLNWMGIQQRRFK